MTTKIDMTRNIRKISLRINNGAYIYGIKFIDEHGEDIMNLDQGEEYSEWVTQELEPNESIIGVYGRKGGNTGYVFNCLGFIVWNK